MGDIPEPVFVNGKGAPDLHEALGLALAKIKYFLR